MQVLKNKSICAMHMSPVCGCVKNLIIIFLVLSIVELCIGST